MATLAGYYTIAEAANVLGVSHSLVARYIRDDRLPATDLGGQKIIEQSRVHEFKRNPPGNPNFRRNGGDDK